MSKRDDYITAIGNMVKGDLPLGEAEKIAAIGQALRLHSRHRPLIVSEDETGTGGFDYAVSLLASWSDGFSIVQKIEYPVDDTDPSDKTLDDDKWTLYSKPAGDCIRFLEDTPETTENFRVTYTAQHSCTDAACTVKAGDEDPVQALAAGFFCEMLSTYYAQSQDSTIGADSVDHMSKSRDYAARAKAWRKIYYNHMGIEEGKTPAASATASHDLHYPGGQERLTHPRAERKKR